MAPSVTDIAPSGMLTSAGATVSATLDDSGSGVNGASVSVSLDGSPMVGCTATASNVSCVVSGLAQGPHNISISAADFAGNPGSGTGSFTVDSLAPVVTDVQPSGNIYGGSTTISATYSDTGSGVNTGSVSISLDGSPLGGCTVTATSVSCPATGLALGAHAISGSVADNAGNIAPISGSFTVTGLAPGLTTMVSSSSAGVPGNGSSYYNMAISADNNYTVFTSLASNLVAGDTNAATDVFMKDNRNGAITRVSTTAAGAQAAGASEKPVVSADGRYVVFRSLASNLVSTRHQRHLGYF